MIPGSAMNGSKSRSRAKPEAVHHHVGHRVVVVQRDLDQAQVRMCRDCVVSSRASSSEANPGKMPDA